jgi:TRAP-type C4-dicarboxylate transport system permease small subunit
VVTKVLRAIAKALTEMASFWLFIVMVLVCMDVSMRYLLSKPIPGILEISEQTVVVLTFVCFAYTSMLKRHIHTTAIVDRLPSGVRPVTEYISKLLMFVMLSLLIWQSSKEAWESLCIREVGMGIVAVPIYITKTVIPIGLFIAWLYYLLGLLGLMEAIEIEE